MSLETEEITPEDYDFLRETHYPEGDDEFIRDYCSIVVKDNRGKTVAEFGDDYHDKGQEKADGFFEGVSFCLGEGVLVKNVNIADGYTV